MSVFVCLKSLQHYGTKWGPFDTAQVCWWTEADGETLGGKETGRQTRWRTSSQMHQGDMAAVACNELWLWDRGRSQKRLERFLGFASSPCNCDCFPLYVRDVSWWISKLLQRPGQLLVSGNVYGIFFSQWMILFDLIFNFVWVGSAFYLFNFILSLSFIFNLFYFTLCHYFFTIVCFYRTVYLGFTWVSSCCSALWKACVVETVLVNERRMRPLPACFIGWCRLDRRVRKLKGRSKKKSTLKKSRQQVDQIFHPHQETHHPSSWGTLRGRVCLLLSLKGRWTDCLYGDTVSKANSYFKTCLIY